MKITIDSKVLAANDISPSQFYLMLSLADKVTESDVNSLIYNKFFLSRNNTTNELFLTQKGSQFISSIINDKAIIPKEKLLKIELLAKELQSYFPEGKKYGTNNYWNLVF